MVTAGQGVGGWRRRTSIEEHIANRRRLFVDFERMPRQDDAFGDHAGRVGVQEASHRDEYRS